MYYTVIKIITMINTNKKKNVLIVHGCITLQLSTFLY